MQSALPAASLYCPAPHTSQPVASSAFVLPVPALPAAQFRQLVPSAAPYVPSAQLEHWDVLVLSVPAAHCVHCAVASAVATVPLGQSVQDDCATEFEVCCPAVQSVQSALATPLL